MVANPFEGWNLVQIAAKIKEALEAIRDLEQRLEGLQKMGKTLDHARKIAEVETRLVEFRRTLDLLRAAETVKKALVVARTAATAAQSRASTGVVVRVLNGVGRVVTFGNASGAVATGAGLVALGIAVWLLSNLAGRMSADRPIEPGPAMTGPRPASPDPAITGTSAPTPTTAAFSDGEFELISSTSSPPTDEAYKPMWKIDKDAGTTRYEYQGLTATYSWTVPKRISKGGTANLDIRGEATAIKGNRLNATIAVSAEGLTLDPEKPLVNKTAEGQQSAGDSQPVKVTDSSGASEAKLSIYVGYTFRFDYVYHRVR